MKITKSIISIIFAAFILFGMFAFIFGEKKTFSENENKNLAKFPDFSIKKLESGDFTAGLEEYMKDHFPMRDPLMKLKTKAQLTAGYKRIGDVHIGKDRLFQQVDEPDASSFVTSANKLFEAIENKDITKSVILLPSASEIYEEELPTYTEHIDETAIIDSILSQIACDNAINPTDMMLDKKSENNLFYTTDHHWTTYAAFYTYELFAKTVGIENVLPLEDREVMTLSDTFKGTLYSTVLDDARYDTVVRLVNPKADFKSFMTKNATKAPEPYEFFAQEFLEMKDTYSYFGGGNFPLVIFESEGAATDNEIVVVKDSFANAFVPFLAEHYKKVHVIDPRYFKGKTASAYVNENENITDVLVLYGINSLNDGVTNFS
ncbi:MAG: hypothetical protein E7656_01825 [Ruminococcaceae bacterium]|nr:hypothetical protein [Oscillospiraceae bacterium]